MTDEEIMEQVLNLNEDIQKRSVQDEVKRNVLTELKVTSYNN